MSNPLTTAIKSSGNVKIVSFRIPANNATFTPVVCAFKSPVTITGCSVAFDGTNTCTGTVAVNAGVQGSTVIACAAVSFAAIAAANSVLDVPVTTAANAIVAAGGVCTLTWTNSSGTVPVGTVTIEYFSTDL